MVKLDKCAFCGAESCLAHAKYTDRCVDCGKRYARFSSYKSLQRSAPTIKRANLLAKIEAEYIDLQTAGYKVPRDFAQKK